MFVQFDFVCGSRMSVQLLKRVRVFVQFHFVFGIDTPVQFLNRVLVRMGVLVGVGMHHAVGVPVLVGVYVRVDVRVWVVVFDLICHHTFLLKSGLEMTGNDGGHVWRQSRPDLPSGAPVFYAGRPERLSAVRSEPGV